MSICDPLKRNPTRSMNRKDSSLTRPLGVDAGELPDHYDKARRAKPPKGYDAYGTKLIPKKPKEFAASVQSAAANDPAVGRRKELEGVFADKALQEAGGKTEPVGAKFAHEWLESSSKHTDALTHHGYKAVHSVMGADEKSRVDIYHHPKTGHVAIHHPFEGWTRVTHAGSSRETAPHADASSLKKHLGRLHG
jgi:hypothetical protein